MLFACAESTGSMRVFGLMGNESLVIPAATGFPGDPSYATAALIFLQYLCTVLSCLSVVIMVS